MDEILKPFDKCLVRNNFYGVWIPALYGKKVGDKYLTSAGWQAMCVPYLGNEDLIGTGNAAFCVDKNGKVVE